MCTRKGSLSKQKERSQPSTKKVILSRRVKKNHLVKAKHKTLFMLWWSQIRLGSNFQQGDVVDIMKESTNITLTCTKKQGYNFWTEKKKEVYNLYRSDKYIFFYFIFLRWPEDLSPRRVWHLRAHYCLTSVGIHKNVET